MPKPVKDCPCHSGLRYSACCAPLHREERAAETPEALMRSRYAAFALGDGAYLVRTLSETHLDRALPEAELARELARAKDGQRYLGLSILHASRDGERGEVLFYARIFASGKDRSFVELSTFVREGGAWRYREGLLLSREAIDVSPETLDKKSFLELYAKSAAP